MSSNAPLPALTADPAWDVALRLAWDSFRAGTTPVGAVIVAPDGRVIASGRGRRYESSAPPQQLANTHIAHGEVNALAQLQVHRHWDDHALLTTLEPCGMCHGAAVQATVGQLLYAAPDPYGGTGHVRFCTPQSLRRPLAVRGPLGDWRGALATLLHIVWLLERPSAGHVVDVHARVLPAMTAYGREMRTTLTGAASAGDYSTAMDIAAEAPLVELCRGAQASTNTAARPADE